MLKNKMDARYKEMNQKPVLFKKGGKTRGGKDSDDDTESEMTESEVAQSYYTSNESFLLQ